VRLYLSILKTAIGTLVLFLKNAALLILIKHNGGRMSAVTIKVNPVKTGDAKPWVFSRKFRAMTARPPKRMFLFNGLE
jgi:hypothetical protein